MPWAEDEWWDTAPDSRREVDGDSMGKPKPIGVLGPDGRELHRIEPVGFTGKARLVYVRKRAK